ncbi:MAG: hypothetical protein ACR2IE_04205 [Candidatus Sumerlaeaceae bacterium]
MNVTVVYMLQHANESRAEELSMDIVKDGQYYPIPRVGELVDTGQSVATVKLVEYLYGRGMQRKVVVVLVPNQ